MGEDPRTTVDIRDVWTRLDDALAEDDEGARRVGIEEAITLADLLVCEDQSAETFYTLGYALYFHPDRATSSSLQERVERALSASLEIDPTYARAWLYLGHHTYDLGAYGKAKRMFLKIPPGALPPYLDLKVREMQLCCGIKLEGIAASMLELKNFVEAAAQQAMEDVWPRQLARVLEQTVDLCNSSTREQLRALARKLDRIGNFGPWFREIVSPNG